MRNTGLLTLLLVIFASSGCTTTEKASVPSVSDLLLERTQQDGRACITVQDIRGYGLLDDDVVSIDAGRHYYLATVRPGCRDLATSTRAAFKQRFSEICGGGVDKIFTRSDYCTIRQIFEFKDRNSAFAAYNNALEQRKLLQQQLTENKD